MTDNANQNYTPSGNPRNDNFTYAFDIRSYPANDGFIAIYKQNALVFGTSGSAWAAGDNFSIIGDFTKS